MKTTSAKAKGRDHQKAVAKAFQEAYGLTPHDVISTPASVPGVDLWLSPLAKSVIPFDVECKRVEKLNIWSALDQTQTNTSEGRLPLLVFRRNRGNTWACLPFDDLLRLLNNGKNTS